MIKAAYKATESHIVVVGGNSEIGQSIISFLLEAGTIVYSIDIQDELMCDDDSNLHYFSSNPVDIQSLEKTVNKITEKTSKLTGLICLTGAMKHYKSIQEQTEQEYLEVFNISFKSCYNACKLFSPLLKNSEKASVVNMSSGLAILGRSKYGPYSNAKAAIISLSKTLAAELAPTIRVNSIAPGAVNTTFLKDENDQYRVNIEKYKALIPLGDLGKTSEIADLILYLLSENASHITGQCIHINGGAMMV